MWAFESLLMPFTPLYIQRETINVREKTSPSDHSPRSSNSPSRHIAHLLGTIDPKTIDSPEFASVNPSRKRKNARRWLIDRRSLDLRRSGVRTDRRRLGNEHNVRTWIDHRASNVKEKRRGKGSRESHVEKRWETSSSGPTMTTRTMWMTTVDSGRS